MKYLPDSSEIDSVTQPVDPVNCHSVRYDQFLRIVRVCVRFCLEREVNRNLLEALRQEGLVPQEVSWYGWRVAGCDVEREKPTYLQLLKWFESDLTDDASFLNAHVFNQ